MTDGSLLFAPLDLPCGAVLKNRIVKSAMSDSLGDGAGRPTAAQCRLYERWAEGGAGLSLIGEVQLGPDHAEKPGNLVLDGGIDDSDRALFRQLAARGAANGAQLWPQLGHAGALAYPPIGIPTGPSALDLPELVCAGMTRDAVRALPARYATTAGLARESGFGGVQIHAGHGFLLSQFLSPLFNRRTDAYGGAIGNRMRLLLEAVDAVRDAVGPAFPVAVKLNSSDMLDGGLTEDESLRVVEALDRSSVDLIDISGGTYFPGAKAASDRAGGGPYFAEFAARARAVTTKPLMLTGGIKTRAQAEDVLARGIVDAVGLARALVLEPALPNLWRAGERPEPAFPRFAAAPEGGVTAWYTMRLTRIGTDADADADADAPADAVAALRDYDARDAARTDIWRARFAGRR